MFKKDNLDVVFDELSDKIYLYADNEYGEEEEFEGDVYINRNEKEVRIYNFKKKDLLEKEKAQLIYCILNKIFLYPGFLSSIYAMKENVTNIADYTFFINGYLLDGSFRDRNKKCNTLIEDFIDGISHFDNETEIIGDFRYKVKYFYDKYSDDIGNKAVNIFVTPKGFFNKIFYCMNFAKLFSAYSKSKGKRIRVITNSNFWNKEKKIEILPY